MDISVRKNYELSSFKKELPSIELEHIPAWLENLAMLWTRDIDLFENFAIAVVENGTLRTTDICPASISTITPGMSEEQQVQIDEILARSILKNFGFLNKELDIKENWKGFMKFAIETSVNKKGQSVRIRTLREIVAIGVLPESIDCQATKEKVHQS